MSLSFILLLAVLVGCSVGDEVKISSVEEFIQFKDNVNNGTNYSGTTVLLDSDLDLAEKAFEPIGNSEYEHKYFIGVFDGQGYVISNLVMDSFSEYVGLFGFSYGLTIKNVILDTSCSVLSSFSGSDSVSVGGIIGYGYASNGLCIIENSVNMGSVSFAGNTDGYFRLGGIIGKFEASDYDAIMMNCANYGDVTYSGMSINPRIGGIVGYSEGYSSKKAYIYNCLNYGRVTHSGTISGCLYLGGVVGNGGFTNFENCVSAGRISSVKASPNGDYIGCVLGYDWSESSIAHCLWTSDVGYNVASGYGTQNITDTSLITALDTITISELNEHAEKNAWSRWVMLHLNGGTISNISQDTQICGLVKSLPVPVKEGHTVDFWCLDEACSEIYNPSTTEMSGVTDLYACWVSDKYTLTFDFSNGTVSSVVLEFNATIEYPEDIAEKKGLTFVGWSPKLERMPAENITVIALWVESQITIKPSTCVEVVFTREGLSEADIKEIVKRFVPEETKFDVMKVESGPDATTIIKFADIDAAENFVGAVGISSDAKRSDIKSVGFVPDGCSFSPSLGLSTLAYFMQYLLFF